VQVPASDLVQNHTSVDKIRSCPSEIFPTLQGKE